MDITNLQQYRPPSDVHHLDRTFKIDGTTITEKGWVTAHQAMSPAVWIIIFILFGLVISSLCVLGIVAIIYKGDIRSAFVDDNNDYYPP